MSKGAIHMSDAEATSDFGAVLDRVRRGTEVVIEDNARPVAVVTPAEPVEHIWSYLKQHELPNLCPRQRWELSATARAAWRRMRRRPTLVTAFWKQAKLF